MWEGKRRKGVAAGNGISLQIKLQINKPIQHCFSGHWICRALHMDLRPDIQFCNFPPSQPWFAVIPRFFHSASMPQRIPQHTLLVYLYSPTFQPCQFSSWGLMVWIHLFQTYPQQSYKSRSIHLDVVYFFLHHTTGVSLFIGIYLLWKSIPPPGFPGTCVPLASTRAHRIDANHWKTGALLLWHCSVQRFPH